MGAQKTALSYLEELRRLKRAGVSGEQNLNRISNDLSDLPTLDQRIKKILLLCEQPTKRINDVLFFVMYDIESNKVRYNVVKYLERQGCIRIQKSIFLADLSSEKYNAIKEDLAEVQSLYDNHDSIIVCPVSTDLLKNMKIIGKSINIDVIAKTKNTLFF